MPRHPEPRVLRVVMGITVAALLLAGCSPEPAPTASSTPSSTPSNTPTKEPEPVFEPDGTAEDNLPFFTRVTEKVWKSDDRASGRAYIDALVKAGFAKDDMQVTEDSSTVGNPAESMQFAVKWDDECLVGQVGPATGDPVTSVMDAVEGGPCLIGSTRDIDW